MNEELQRLMDEVSEWQHKTFHTVECVNISRHLEKEAKELTEAIEIHNEKGTVETLWNMEEEMADCLILLVSCAKKAGFDSGRLLSAAYSKLHINKRRKWGEQNEDGTFTHIE